MNGRLVRSSAEGIGGFALAVALIGFSGIVAQVLLLREFLVIFSGNELSVGLILANWLILESAGAYLLGKAAGRIGARPETFALLNVAFAAAFPLAVFLVRDLKVLLGVIPGVEPGIAAIFLSSLVILLPVSSVHAALFALSCRLYSDRFPDSSAAGGIGRVYVYETVGTLAGGLVFTFLLAPAFNSFRTALAVSWLNALVAVYALRPLRGKGRTPVRKAAGYAAAAALVVFSCLCFSRWPDRAHRFSLDRQWRGQRVLFYRNSVYGNVAVTEADGQFNFFANGVPVITAPTPDIAAVEEFAHLPMLFSPRPRTILVLGGGAGGLINEIRKYRVERIDYVELDPLILEAVKKFPTALTAAELGDPRVNVEYLDGRFFVKNTARRYDLIFLGLADISSLQVNRIFTAEFFALVRSRLNGGGILAFRLPGSLTYLSPELKNLNACVLNALREVYPGVRVVPGDGANLFLASGSPGLLQQDAGDLIRRLEAENLHLDFVGPGWLVDKLEPQKQAWFSGSLSGATGRVNRDFRPAGVFFNLAYWNAAVSPSLRPVFASMEKLSLGPVLGFIVALTLIFSAVVPRVRGGGLRPAVPLDIAVTGFAGLVFTLLLIFAFQIFYGYVFQWIGVLVAVFMAGTAAGGLGMTFRPERMENDVSRFLQVDLLLVVFAVLLAAVFSVIRATAAGFTFFLQAVFLLFSFLAGSLVGVQFPLAGRIYLRVSPEPGRAAGVLYAADLFGGWLGGILGTVALLPVLGLPAACLLVAALKLSGFIVLAAAGRGKDISV